MRITDLSIERAYKVEELVGYMSTWHGYQRYLKVNQHLADPLKEASEKLQRIFADSTSDAPVQCSFPTFMILARNG